MAEAFRSQTRHRRRRTICGARTKSAVARRSWPPVKAAADNLPLDERLHLRMVFSASEPLPARDIARLMGSPVEQVYPLKQRTRRWLKEMVQLEKNLDAAVLTGCWNSADDRRGPH